MGEAATIDEVVERLDAIIGSSESKGSRLGYFPALYRKVTIEVNDKIASGFFDDRKRMEQLDVIFANRYLGALKRYSSSERATEVWHFAFDVTQQWWPYRLAALAARYERPHQSRPRNRCGSNRRPKRLAGSP